MTSKPTSDVAVVGAGIWGLACAYACALRGMTVRVYDTFDVAAGASGGIVGAMAPHTPDPWNGKKAFQFEALDTAPSYWQKIADSAGRDPGYARIGRLVPLVSERALTLAQVRVGAAKRNWGARYDWQVHTTARQGLNPDIAPFGWIWDSLSARIHPRQATQALAQACREVGVTIHSKNPVAWRNETFRTAKGPIHAQTTILAAGVAGFELAGLPAAGVKGQAAMLRADLSSLPQIYADGIYIVPHQDGKVAVGSTSENTWTHAGCDEKLQDVLRKAAHILPALQSAPVIERWSGVRPRAPKRDPMLGPHPSRPNVLLALGAFKIGFGVAHKVGEALADFVETGTAQIPDSFCVAHHLEPRN